MPHSFALVIDSVLSVNLLELQAALNAARDRSVELSTSLEDEKNRSAFLEMSLETEKDKNDESAKTEKIVAHQLKGALDVVQVWNIGWSRCHAITHLRDLRPYSPE